MKGSLCRLAETSFLWRDTAMRIRERFNPRAPCGARPVDGGVQVILESISTHAPLAGRDGTMCPKWDRPPYFNPRAPCGARRRDALVALHFEISTHAPLAGRDHGRCRRHSAKQGFQPTRPLRGATEQGVPLPFPGRISTHAPLAGRDRRIRRTMPAIVNFNPRAPCGARQGI